VENLPQVGETVLGQTYAMAPGGKGANQALAARRAGAEVVFTGCTGKDGFADQAQALLREAGVTVTCRQSNERPTACALIIIDKNGRNQIAVASGANMAAKSSDVPDTLLASGTIIVLQMEVDASENWALVARAKQRGCRILLNVAPAGAVPSAILPQVDWLVVNEGEAVAVAQHLEYKGEDPSAAGAYIFSKTGVTVIVTLGAAGALAFGTGPTLCVNALDITPVDTTSAGDSFVGAFAAALDQGYDLAEAMRWGAAAGSLACLEIGAQTSVPERSQITARLNDVRVSQRAPA
jgi:ribokinase